MVQVELEALVFTGCVRMGLCTSSHLCLTAYRHRAPIGTLRLRGGAAGCQGGCFYGATIERWLLSWCLK